jgi:hypothetical protein
MAVNTISVRRTVFLRQKNTLTSISQSTGIPISTLSYVSRGERNLPSKYTSVLRNYYQRNTYQIMRSSGISVNQAHRFSWYNPEKVQSILVEFETKIKYLTEGYVANYKKYIDGEIEDDQVMELWYDGEEAIRKGIEESDQPYETWLDYGTR